jgi:uncharacterized protein YfaS (alpha-2-macroglobulin family)
MKSLFWIFLVSTILQIAGMAQDPDALRQERDQLVKAGLHREWITLYVDRLVPISDGESASDLRAAIDALEALNAWKEFDGLVELAVSNQKDNAAVLEVAARNYQRAPHWGRLIGGEFERESRGMHGGRMALGDQPAPSAGSVVDASFRDYVRSLQLLRQALAVAKDDGQRAVIWSAVAAALQSRDAWQFQTLTSLDALPAWGELGPEGGTEGAPWTRDRPVLFEIPATWESAKNDGERWRFSLAAQSKLNASAAFNQQLQFARFSRDQFGTETLSSYGWWRQQDPESAKGILELDTLADDECLAKTSDGVRRFKLPREHHFIALYSSIVDEVDQAGDELVQIFLNRRQLDRAREVLEKTIAKHGQGIDAHRKKLLEQITGNWGRFEPAPTVAEGTKPTMPLVFRNASAIKLSAAPVDMEAVFRDTVAYLTSNPPELEWELLDPSAIASRLISGDATKYLGDPTTTWEATLTPREKHRDTRTEIEVPISQAGAWWVSGELENGNSFHTLVWVIDSVIVQNNVGGKVQWWVADAATGSPVADAEVEFFGYRTHYLERNDALDRRLEIRTKTLKRTTDDDGKTLLKPGDSDESHLWLTIARKKDRTTAFVGFRPFSVDSPEYENGNRDLTYGITDRPLYKPGDTVHLKFFLRNVGYSKPEESRWANQVGQLVLTSGRGEEVLKIESLTTDELGAVEADLILPEQAGLGVWQASYQIAGRIAASVSFRVEEFRKPEYEVKVEAPKDPVRLGEKFNVTVKASYFHGAPVRKADVEIVVKRASIHERWFPAGRWDWLYGRGAWWTASEAPWHPTWQDWGTIPPMPPWWHGQRWTPDELVLKTRLALGADGTAIVEIDTASAKATHGDLDARYLIEARVVDASRREERGNGTVIAARKPFEVAVWTDRGHTLAGEPIEATISAATLAGQPVVAAKGSLKLYQLTPSKDGRIDEKEIQSWSIETDASGQAQQKLVAPATGQYRLAARLSFNEGEAAEGATIVNVHGAGRSEPGDWKFGALELISDKSTYSPGETLKLRVNSDHENAHVWLFLHIAGSSGREARRIQLAGKSLEVEVPLDLKDMPNMFIQGITVHGAEIHQAVRQVLLPPISKLIDVTLTPVKGRVKPRETSALRVTLRDSEGKPVTGTAVLTVYDKALESITGGSNVPPIAETFWNWKNTYVGGGGVGSIPQSPGHLQRPEVIGMSSLGRFGEFRGRGKGGGDGVGFAVGRSMEMSMAVEDRAEMLYAELGMAASSTPELPTGAPIVVRKDFADLLKWSGEVRTDADGNAEVALEFPDNLTTWKARVWVLGKDTHVGEGSAEVITSKELLVRLQAPRFLVERDESVVSAIVQNDHDSPKTVKVSLELDGSNLTAIDGAPQTVEISARSEARVDWRVRAISEGQSTVRMRADSGDDGDAIERKLPIRVHGMLRQDAWSRVIPADQAAATIPIDVPAERRPDQTKLTVRFSPTIAGAVVDAIPYLASYPHGCTEQTLNRFVPAVIAQQMLMGLKIDLADVKAKRTNLNPQEIGNASERSAQWKQWQSNPVFDELEIENMVAMGVKRLMTMQNSDGGWGWFSGFREASYPHTTALVVHGLLTAKSNGAEIPERMIESGVSWLAAYERQQAAALQLHVERLPLRSAGKEVKNDGKIEKSACDALDALVRLVLGEAGLDSEPMLAFLHRDRISLPVYAKCLLGIEHHRKGEVARRDEVMKIISQFLKRDAENQTAYLELGNSGYWWNWYGSEVEAHAWYLKLLAAVKPQDPDTRGLVKYLVNNRRHATYWESTRDTAFAVEAIATYLKASGEDAPQMDVEVLLGEKSLRKVSIDRSNLFTFDGTVILTGDEITTGKHQIEVRRSGKGNLYANAYLEVFTLEEKLRAAGLEVKVERKVSKLIALEEESEVPDASGLVVKQAVERFRREPLADGAKLVSGDRVEVELILESKNDYEYLIFSDAKAAGFEVLDALSGVVDGGGGFSAFMEPRDQSVDFYIRELPRGTHSLRYQLRAEAPGIYKALPAIAEAMYAPELRANSEDIRLEIGR